MPLLPPLPAGLEYQVWHYRHVANVHPVRGQSPTSSNHYRSPNKLLLIVSKNEGWCPYAAVCFSHQGTQGDMEYEIAAPLHGTTFSVVRNDGLNTVEPAYCEFNYLGTKTRNGFRSVQFVRIFSDVVRGPSAMTGYLVDYFDPSLSNIKDHTRPWCFIHRVSPADEENFVNHFRQLPDHAAPELARALELTWEILEHDFSRN